MGARYLSHSDVILPMQDPYMTQIVDGSKNYDITHVCETQCARTRNPGDRPLEENGLGNAEYNNRHKDWDGYDFAYKIVTVCELRQPITLKEMKEKHGFKSAPRGLVYLPKSINDSVDLKKQKLLLDRRN
ncbi:uncharacterized protein N7515_006842 [Penicillium bovifimosum]|uniref:Uncharacterized protein n=1 Tax=Penicillium bovifimosum TaxID=126998 RepID=A0A9W9L044_9EURO|nr:uncharacterized protein N7515_006842 [Penicillium bovifimosum]KAJ5130803.1 hypothetical protein N7515_006842 [Penicillium bovifimosum]